MIKEEAIEVLKDIYNYTRFDTYTTNEARTMAIKALEQEPCDEQEIYEKAHKEGYTKGWDDGYFIGKKVGSLVAKNYQRKTENIEPQESEEEK